MAIVLATIALGSAALPSTSYAQEQCLKPQEATRFGSWIAPNFSLSEATPRFTEYGPGEAGFTVNAMRLLLKSEGGSSERWTLTIRDSQYRVLLSLGPKDFVPPSGGGDPQRWTDLLPVGTVKFDLTTNDLGTVRLKVAIGLLYPKAAEGEKQFSLQGPTPKWQSLYESSQPIAKQIGDTVGMLAAGAQVGQSKVSWCCSGVMLSPDIFLTNWHCGGAAGLHEDEYWGTDVCRNTIVDLGWEDRPQRRQFSCHKVLFRNRPLDFVLLRLVPIAGAGQGQPRPAELAFAAALNKDDEVFLVHHALCMQKYVSDKCYVKEGKRLPWRSVTGQTGIDSIGTDPEPGFTHTCDTEPGASGAPVLDTDGKVVGLHHLGFHYDNQCTPDKSNKAVKIKEILKVIKRDAPADVVRDVGIQNLRLD